eukprot:m.215082 g.215082  ORF g.215082 m.215082 type:complete len:247 (-) comp33183_c0_seq1:1815-2555(-)
MQVCINCTMYIIAMHREKIDTNGLNTIERKWKGLQHNYIEYKWGFIQKVATYAKGFLDLSALVSSLLVSLGALSKGFRFFFTACCFSGLVLNDLVGLGGGFVGSSDSSILSNGLTFPTLGAGFSDAGRSGIRRPSVLGGSGGFRLEDALLAAIPGALVLGTILGTILTLGRLSRLGMAGGANFMFKPPGDASDLDGSILGVVGGCASSIGNGFFELETGVSDDVSAVRDFMGVKGPLSAFASGDAS